MVIDELKEYGVDMDTAMKRCVNNEGLYIKLCQKIPNMKEFDELKQSINDKDLEKAFSTAHALKGIVANLAITPLEKPLSEITELLRNKEDIDYSPYVEEIDEAYTKFCDILAKA